MDGKKTFYILTGVKVGNREDKIISEILVEEKINLVMHHLKISLQNHEQTFVKPKKNSLKVRQRRKERTCLEES